MAELIKPRRLESRPIRAEWMASAWHLAPATSHCVHAFTADEKADDAPSLGHGDVFRDTLEVGRQCGQRDECTSRDGPGCQLVWRVTLA